MDQGVLENLKRRYKKHLLRKLLLGSLEHQSFAKCTKSLTIKDAVYFGAMSWNEVSSISLSRASNKLGLGSESESSSSLKEELPDLSSDCDVLGITDNKED